MKIAIRHQVLELAQEGFSEPEISEILGLNPTDVRDILWRFGHMMQDMSLSNTMYVKVFELKKQGLDIAQIADTLSVPELSVEASIRKDRAKIKDNPRAEEFLSLYKGGESLESISQKFGLTRERVRQVTKKQFGFELGYGPTEQKIRKNEIDSKYRELVVQSRGERKEDAVNERIEAAINKGIEPEYFDSISKFAQATGVGLEQLKEYRPDIYRTVWKNAHQKSKRWSWYYDACRMCGTTTVKHKIYGYCKNCYYKSPEFKSVQQRSYAKTRDNRLEYNKQYGEDYYNRPEVKDRLDREYDEKYFGGNRRLALERDNHQCLGCGMSTEEKDKAGKPRVRVWHLGKKDDHSLDNLGTYCQSCLYNHGGVNLFNKSRRIS